MLWGFVEIVSRNVFSGSNADCLATSQIARVSMLALPSNNTKLFEMECSTHTAAAERHQRRHEPTAKHGGGRLVATNPLTGLETANQRCT